MSTTVMILEAASQWAIPALVLLSGIVATQSVPCVSGCPAGWSDSQIKTLTPTTNTTNCRQQLYLRQRRSTLPATSLLLANHPLAGRPRIRDDMRNGSASEAKMMRKDETE